MNDPEQGVAEGISTHVFSVSAAMVGVCLTVIGIIRVVIASRPVVTLADDVLALDSLLFLASCLLAYSALRSDGSARARRLERLADVLFIPALVLMAVAAVLITYAVI